MTSENNGSNSFSKEIAESINKKSTYATTAFDFLLLLIGIISALAILMITVNLFDVPTLVGFSLSLTIIIFILVSKRKIVFKEAILSGKTFFLILAVAIIFRVGSFTYYIGGQDEGLYVNMSQILIANHGVNNYDAFRASLPKDLQIIYDDVNYDNINLENSGGMNLTDATNSISQVKFYPLNGVWLAIFETIFGLGKHGYATQFFSILVVIGIYLLTWELTAGNKKAAAIAMLFASLNPAFVFFSKFPVSETLAMAFSVNGFYLLVKGLKNSDSGERFLLLTSSALLLGLFNFVRFSFIIFIPTLALILISAYLFSDLRKLRLSISLFIGGVIILYGISWIYYYFIQTLVANKITNVWMLPLLEKSWPFLVLLAFCGIFVYWLRKKSSEKPGEVVLPLINKLENVPAWLFPVTLFLSIIPVVITFRIYQYDSIRFSNFYNFMLLISPFSLIFIFAMPFLKIRLTRIQSFVVLTIVVAWIALFASGFSGVPYKYYYTRYMTSEVLLYSIILVSIALTILLERNGQYKKLSTIMIVSIVLYFSFFSSIQIGRAETENPQIYFDLNKFVDKNDVIVSFLPLSFSTPLEYYFDKNVFPLNSSYYSMGNEVINRLSSSGRYDNVYILADGIFRNSYKSYGWDLINRYTEEFNYYSDGIHTFSTAKVNDLSFSQFILPTKYIQEQQLIYLYKFMGNNVVDITKGLAIDCGASGNLGMFVVQGFSPSEADHTWTDGKLAILRFLISNSSSLKTNLNFTMSVSGFTLIEKYQRVTILANSQKVYSGEIGGENSSISFQIPMSLVQGQDELEIEFDLPDATPSPGDPRSLGLSLKRITIKPDN